VQTGRSIFLRAKRTVQVHKENELAASSLAELNVDVDSDGSLESEAPLRRVRRRIDQRAGRALEILGHAIEYLTDEYVHELATEEQCPFSKDDGRVQAIQLLMSLNREIYFECPEVEDLSTRCLSVLRGLWAWKIVDDPAHK
jgi:hypothetical protein